MLHPTWVPWAGLIYLVVLFIVTITTRIGTVWEYAIIVVLAICLHPLFQRLERKMFPENNPNRAE
jgi:predicted PurR-regulated permease PerM